MEKDNQPGTHPDISRRTFLKRGKDIGKVLAATALTGPGPSRPPEANHRPEIFREVEVDVIVDYKKAKQKINYKLDEDRHPIVTSCEEPEFAEQPPGFTDTEGDFDWTQHELKLMDFSEGKLEVLTSSDLTEKQLTELEEWWRDSEYINNRLKELNLPEPAPKTIPALIINFRGVRNSYMQQNDEGTYVHIYDTGSDYDPEQLFSSFTEIIDDCTQGQLKYAAAETITWTEADHPLTNDPTLTEPQLIESYGNTINYAAIVKAARDHGVNTVFVYGGDNAGMREAATWVDPETKEPITIFGLNYNRSVDLSIHSWIHYLETKIKQHSELYEVFNTYTGRLAEDDELSYGDPDSPTTQNSIKFLKERGTMASLGYGTIHLAPNAIAQYQIDSEVPVFLPDRLERIDSTEWGATELGYYTWWLKNLPKEFLTNI
ncbi:MAG: hypothetical protein M3Q44_00830 [bacterium]|nr:hypothetical protein [bacterium]